MNPLPSPLIFRCVFVLALCVTTYVTLIDLSEFPPINIWDKLLHASTFLLLSFLLHHSFANTRLLSPQHIAQLVFLLCYGIMIEWLQSYTPYREASLLDVLADAAGILCYWSLYLCGKNAIQRR